MKNVLVVCPCSFRGSSIGLIEDLLFQFKKARLNGCTIDLFDTHCFQIHDPSKYDVRTYYGIHIGRIRRIALRMPLIRSRYARYLFIERYREILRSRKYDFILFYKVPPFSDILIDIAHKVNSKVLLFPWGSEVLRADTDTEKHLKIAYSNADYIIGYEKSNLVKKASSIYKVPNDKILQLKTVLKGIKSIKEVSTSLKRTELETIVGIPSSDYNIICGYSGCETQRHIEMIKAFEANKKFLPRSYQLIFPVTYVANPTYIQKLRNLCESYGLNAVFITEYLSDEQIACLHLVTDLFINIQPTDAGNAFMIESLFCANQIITGKWLKYDQFEEFGTPYYSLDKLDDLVLEVEKILTGKVLKREVPQQLIDKYDFPDGYDRGNFWINLFCD